MTGMFSAMYGNSVLAMGDKNDIGQLVFVLFWNENDSGSFPKMWYGVSVEDNVVHVCEVSNGKRP